MTSLNEIQSSFFINLARRKDRLKHINESICFDAKRFPAKDKSELTIEEAKKFFPNGYKKNSKGEIACAISHYSLWRKLLNSNEENMLILEDDVVFNTSFDRLWNNIFSKEIPEDYFLIYLGGCQPWNKKRYHEVLCGNKPYFKNVMKNSLFLKDSNYWHMNAQSYLLHRSAAKILCSHIDKHGFEIGGKPLAQDVLVTALLSQIDYKKVFHLNPSMSRQIHEKNYSEDQDKNSDLRFCTERFKDKNEGKRKLIFLDNNLFEEDFIKELLSGVEYDLIFDPEMKTLEENAIIVYSDIFCKDINVYPEKYRNKLNSKRKKLQSFFERAKGKNCHLFHLSDEHCHADISHYKYFKHIYRQYYRKDADLDNVTVIPLGYKKGFNDISQT